MTVRSQVGPWSMVPTWILGIGLSGSELVVYVALRSFADRDGEAHPHFSSIAERAGVSVRSVERAIARFRTLGILATTRRYRADGGLAGLTFRMVDVMPEHLGKPVEPDDEPTHDPGTETPAPTVPAPRKPADDHAAADAADRDLWNATVGVDTLQVLRGVTNPGTFTASAVHRWLTRPSTVNRKTRPGAWLAACHDVDQALATVGVER